LHDRCGRECGRASDQFAALLSVLELRRGPEDPGTLSVRDSLTVWTQRAGVSDPA